MTNDNSWFTTRMVVACLPERGLAVAFDPVVDPEYPETHAEPVLVADLPPALAIPLEQRYQGKLTPGVDVVPLEVSMVQVRLTMADIPRLQKLIFKN